MMTKKLLWILGMVWALLGGVGIGTAQVGQDVVVVNTLEDRESGCPEVCSLREAVAIVAEGGTVIFRDDLAGQIPLSAPILIERDVTLQGLANMGIVLSGDLKTQLLIVRDAIVWIQNLSFFAGYAEDSGGAIDNDGTLKLEHTLFTGNRTDGSGGAIFNSGSLTVHDSQFTLNRAQDGGAITSKETHTTIITASSLIANTALEDGGALYGDFGGFVVINSTLTNNEARRGGAILMDGFLERGVVTNSTITWNRAEFGGGVCNLDEDSLFMLASSIVAENDAERSPDVCPLMTSGGHNLIGDSEGRRWIESDLLNRDPRLRWLDNYDWWIPTYALENDSPAIGMGDCSGNAALFIEPVLTDQRGVARKTPCDVGAYETESAAN